MPLYFILDIASIAVPLLFSFHPRIRFNKRWPRLWPAIAIVGGIYLAWDIVFTYNDYWKFNADYLLGINFILLPIEEWLFFVCIPYACVFTHYVIRDNTPNLRLSKSVYEGLTRFLLLLLLVSIVLFYNRTYTVVNSILTGSILIITLANRSEIFSSFYISFFILLFPFLLINGILTGSFIEEEIVWYDNRENTGFRIFTIPVEDIFYAMGMILGTILIMEWRPIKSKVESPS